MIIRLANETIDSLLVGDNAFTTPTAAVFAHSIGSPDIEPEASITRARFSGAFSVVLFESLAQGATMSISI